MHWEVVLLKNTLPGLQELQIQLEYSTALKNSCKWLHVYVEEHDFETRIYQASDHGVSIKHLIISMASHPSEVSLPGPISVFLKAWPPPAASSVPAPGPVRICSCRRCSSHQSDCRGQQRNDSLDFGCSCMFCPDMVAWNSALNDDILIYIYINMHA